MRLCKILATGLIIVLLFQNCKLLERPKDSLVTVEANLDDATGITYSHSALDHIPLPSEAPIINKYSFYWDFSSDYLELTKNDIKYGCVLPAM